MFSHGVPASVTSPTADGQLHGIPSNVNSPTPDGQLHGVPSNVNSPTPIPPGVHVPLRQQILQGPHHRFGNGFGNGREHRTRVIPVPVFYPIYGWGDPAYPIADPAVPAQPQQDPITAANQTNDASDDANADDQLKAAYLQGARDALRDTVARNGDSRSGSGDSRYRSSDSRYGEHYMDSREQTPSARVKSAPAPEPEPEAAPAAKADPGPAAIFIFKDGHKIETHNYAIMGETLYDFSSTGLKRVQLADLDKDATLKENDDRGISLKLP